MREFVLWGHHVDEYKEMFDLSANDFQARLLEYGCGPSAINAELHEITPHVVSCDPLFVLDKATMLTKTSLIFEDMAAKIMQSHGELEPLLAYRRNGMQTFFQDYERGLAEGRYLPVRDYKLPFADFSFDFALSAHYLFADLEDQTVDLHLQIIRELARVCREVRIFPLIDRFEQLSALLGPVLLTLQQENYGVEVRKVRHVLPKDNAMLRIWAQECKMS